jgi:hypothetical protein
MHLLPILGLLLLGIQEEQKISTLLRILLVDSPYVTPETEGGILSPLEVRWNY